MVMSAKMSEPVWRRLGWVPYAVLILVVAAADLCFPLWQVFSFHSPGIGTSIGVLLFIGVILLMRSGVTSLEQVFLILMGAIGFSGLLVCGLGYVLVGQPFLMAASVYELEKQLCTEVMDVNAAQVQYQMQGFFSRLQIAALAWEEKHYSWTTWTLRCFWDRRAAEYILGRPIVAHPFEPSY